MTDFCAQLSLAASESLPGTATAETDTWLALEHPGPWSAKAYDECELPGALRQRLDELLGLVPTARIQLVKSARTDPSGPVSLLIGRSGGPEPQVRRLTASSYEGLVEQELEAAVMGAEVGEPVTSPTVLVCTNGKRDQCCARFGVPIHRALSEQEGIEVWETTHLGGHRFAPTVVVLPAGVCYGRIQPDEVGDLAAASRSGEVFRLDRYRGRTCYSPQVQAAEHFAREHTGEMRIVAVRPLGYTDPTEGSWRVRVAVDTKGAYDVELGVEPGRGQRPKSCGEDPRPFERFVLDSITAVG